MSGQNATHSPHFWIIDSDREAFIALSQYFATRRFQFCHFGEFKDARAILETLTQKDPVVQSLITIDKQCVELPDLFFINIDLLSPNLEEQIDFLRKYRPESPIVILRNHNQVIDQATNPATNQTINHNRFRPGQCEFLNKPLLQSDLDHLIERVLHLKNLEQENEYLREAIKGQWKLGKMIGKSPAMKNVFDLVHRVAGASANVLITGESGTGKELVAQAIHQLGPRSTQPFVAINCSAIPDQLLESELFGHAKGSFTGAIQRKKGLFEEANGGTLFLDEIGDLNPALQAKLLRVLQEKRIRAVGDNQSKDVDVRLVAATHRDLKTAISDGTFREDLYYRLSVIPIVLPPLRCRLEDIPLLAEHFLAKYRVLNRSQIKGFTKAAMERLVHYSWPGNVRELENLIERVVVLSEKHWIEAEDITLSDHSTFERFFLQNSQELPSLAELERRYIDLVLEKTNGKKEQAAEILGIHRRTLYRKEHDSDFAYEPKNEATQA